jgi:transcriptional regulator with XRE-family HTH domain
MIRQCREKHGWTQYQLADKFRKMDIPITRDIIANIETQRSAITDCQLFFFARVLGVSWAALFPNKATLDKFLPHSTAKQPEQADRSKRPLKKVDRAGSRKGWGICEMTCKSVKITFRASS